MPVSDLVGVDLVNAGVDGVGADGEEGGGPSPVFTA